MSALVLYFLSLLNQHELYKKYLRFEFENQIFELLSSALYVFTKRIKPVVSHLTSKFLIVNYLDIFIFYA